MVKKSYRSLILVLIYLRSGKWGWYQLERELDRRSIGGQFSAYGIAEILINEGLVEGKVTSDRPDPTYFITRKGEEKVQELIETYGIEIFGPVIQNRDEYEL